MKCPVCNKQFQHIAMDYQNISIFKCECGMGASGLTNQDVYTDPNRLSDWDGFYSPNAIKDNEVFLNLIKKYSKGRNFLDVGTGSGCLPYLAKEQGFNAEGTDISQNACKVVQSQAGIRMHCGKLEDLNLEKKYDIISMIHLLEHTDDPLITLEKAASLLANDGILFLIVPNYSTISIKLKSTLSRYRLYSKPYKHLACFHHKWFFNLATLEKLGLKIGLKTLFKKTMSGVDKNQFYHSFSRMFDADNWLCIVFTK